MNKVEILKQNNEDFEWYPTTNEILYVIEKDLHKHHQQQKYSSHRREGIYSSYNHEQKDYIFYIDHFIDIGAGDGRVLEYFDSNKFRIKNKYGIELARTQADDLIKRNVGLIGRDYFETVLIDKFYDVVFSNPPYSMFKMWCQKLLHEVNAEYIYLVLPERWINDDELLHTIKEKGQWEIIGKFDFLHAEREARAKIDVIRIYKEVRKDNSDTFVKWVNDNIGEFKENPKEEIKEETETYNNLTEAKESIIETLVNNYNNDLAYTLETYRAIARLDFSLLKSLGLNKQDVINKIKSDIESLKNKYWMKTFDHIKTISEKLTYKTRTELFNKIQWFKQLDFNHNNIYTIIVWVVENYNKYVKEQMIKAFEDLTNFDQVRAYKSNDKWFDAGWRYTNKQPEKYSLDYRIVVYCGSKFNMKWKYEHPDNNPAVDLSIVARTLGFDNQGINEETFERGKSYNCLSKDGSVLFNYRVYQNNNVHFKLNQEFLKVFNIEVGKVKQWLHTPKDIQEEFNISEEESIKFFTNSELQLMNTQNQKLLTF